MRRTWFQFRLRTFLLAIPILGLALTLMTVKIRQDQEFKRAWYDLAKTGMGWTIGPEVTIGPDLKLVSTRTAWTGSDVNQLVQTIEILSKPRDLGFTKGCSISMVDFKNSQISDESLERIRQVLPNARVSR